jgi:hypothetical protein
MDRQIFCHEEELLRRFAACEFAVGIDWCRTGLTDDLWGLDGALGRSPMQHCLNVNYRTEYLQGEVPINVLTKVAQIHPGHLSPAIFVSVDRSCYKVYSIELMNGEATRLSDYRIAVSRIESIADSAASQFGFKKQLRWWRVFAMFDRILFLTLKSQYSQAINARREVYELPEGLKGECVGLYKGSELVGLDGWFAHETGFGADAPV